MMKSKYRQDPRYDDDHDNVGDDDDDDCDDDDDDEVQNFNLWPLSAEGLCWQRLL